MNNCFCELPDLDNPFTVDDILCEEDLDLIHNYSQQSNLGADKVQWHDSTSDFYTGKEFKHNFSGVGYITDKKVMRRLNEFVRDNFPDEFIKDMWSTPMGHRFFPCTLLAWNDPSDWHCEGVQYPAHNNPIVTEQRFSTVCNFRLIGDPINSQILFADGDDALQQATEEIVTDYINKDVVGQSSKDIFSHIKPRSYTADKSLMTSSPNDYFCKPDVWEPHLTQIAVKQGFNNPFLLNLAKWHKVKIEDNTPRVTLRLMAEKDIPFSTWEKMVDNGTFLK